MVPTHVQQRDPERWWPWTSGWVDPAMLRLKHSGEETCYVNGCLVRQLRFEDGRVWSPMHGWQKEVKPR